MYDFLLVTNGNFGRIFEISTLEAGKSLNFHTLPFLEAPSGGIPLDMDVNYTPLKIAFNGLQFLADITGPVSYTHLTLPTIYSV